ncbi:MAG: hypothetical protein ACXW4K_07035 [Candidatus Deferrimicrobiaceae bacterium]
MTHRERRCAAPARRDSPEASAAEAKRMRRQMRVAVPHENQVLRHDPSSGFSGSPGFQLYHGIDPPDRIPTSSCRQVREGQ